MLRAYHPTENKLISHKEYLEYTLESGVQDRKDALKARCPVCNDAMTIVAGKKKDDGHFRHASINDSCPTKTSAAAPYENLRPSKTDLHAVALNKEFVRDNINQIWHRLKELVPLLNVEEVVDILSKAKELNIYSYANLRPEQIVYIYVNLINFIPKNSIGEERIYKFLFFYESNDKKTDLWINNGKPSKLFRISYNDENMPMRVMEYDSSTDYLSDNEKSAPDWVLQKLLKAI